MEKKSWQFRATPDTFDGERVLREAKEAGLQVVEVNVKGNDKVVLFVTPGFLRRLNRARGKRSGDLPMNIPEGGLRGRLDLVARESHGDTVVRVSFWAVEHFDGWICYGSFAPSHGAELMREVEEFERRLSTVVVRGYK